MNHAIDCDLVCIWPMNLQGHQIGHFANEAGQALSAPIGSPDEATVLRTFLQVNV